METESTKVRADLYPTTSTAVYSSGHLLISSDLNWQLSARPIVAPNLTYGNLLHNFTVPWTSADPILVLFLLYRSTEEMQAR